MKELQAESKPTFQVQKIEGKEFQYFVVISVAMNIAIKNADIVVGYGNEVIEETLQVEYSETINFSDQAYLDILSDVTAGPLVEQLKEFFETKVASAKNYLLA